MPIHWFGKERDTGCIKFKVTNVVIQRQHTDTFKGIHKKSIDKLLSSTRMDKTQYKHTVKQMK
jgi:hypothetical protein